MGQQWGLLHNFVEVTEPGEQRLVLEAPSKASRRLLIGALVAARSKLKARAHLTDLEKANKSQVYGWANKHHLLVQNMGDVCMVRCGGPGG